MDVQGLAFPPKRSSLWFGAQLEPYDLDAAVTRHGRFEMESQLDEGRFVLSLDFELAWGMRDLLGDNAQDEECERTRDVVVPRLLELFERYQVPATWCTVGQLFDSEIASPVEEHFATLVPPEHDWLTKPWFEGLEAGTEQKRRAYLAPGLIAQILSATPAQEIGSHSFTHVIFGDQGCSRACAETEIDACVERAAHDGLRLQSFAFPRNEVGHRDVLRHHGFRCYRGPETNWFYRPWVPQKLARIAHLASVLAGVSALPVLPRRDELGLWDIPGSMILLPAHGIRRFVPMSRRVQRAARGIRAAVQSRGVFHLWFHPINLAVETDPLFEALERILQLAAAHRDRGELEFQSMGDLAAHCEKRGAADSAGSGSEPMRS